MIGTRSELIDRLGREYMALREKYPESHEHAWRPLAVGIALAALAEEEFQMDWRDICAKRRRQNATREQG